MPTGHTTSGAREDLLDMTYINSLPQPFLVRELGSDWWWPVHDIEVETGLYRIDVMGKLDVRHISDARWFRDANGRLHASDAFYSDATDEDRAMHFRTDETITGETK